MQNWIVKGVSAKAALVAGGLALATASGAAIAAGSHEGGHGHGNPIGKKGNAEQVDRTIAVTMKDNLFKPEQIKVLPGETIRFKLHNTGEFVHEFNIATPEMHESHQSEMMEMMNNGVLGADHIDHDKMQQMGMSHDHANSVLLEPGDKAEVIWTFPEEAELEFACNVPGHYESGMVGRFRFKHAHES